MEYITHEADAFVRRVELYSRRYFANNPTKYICWYKDEDIGKNAGRLVYSEQPDPNADIIFEKTINPELDPHGYICIKCGDEWRDD